MRQLNLLIKEEDLENLKARAESFQISVSDLVRLSLSKKVKFLNENDNDEMECMDKDKAKHENRNHEKTTTSEALNK